MSNEKVVVASNSDFGVSSKAMRGLAGGLAGLPDSLVSAKGTLERFAARMGVSLDGTVSDIAQSMEKALRAQVAAPAVAPAPSSPGLSM